MSDIIRKIEDLSMAIVMANPSDLQELADLYKRFEEISTIASNESHDSVAKAAAATASLIESIIMNEVADKEAAYQTISQAASAIQAIVVDRRGAGEVTFPKGLGLAEADETQAAPEQDAASDETGQSVPGIGTPEADSDTLA